MAARGSKKLWVLLIRKACHRFHFLTDDQLLEIINYIRGTMVQAEPLSLEELHQYKKSGKKP